MAPGLEGWRGHRRKTRVKYFLILINIHFTFLQIFSLHKEIYSDHSKIDFQFSVEIPVLGYPNSKMSVCLVYVCMSVSHVYQWTCLDQINMNFGSTCGRDRLFWNRTPTLVDNQNLVINFFYRLKLFIYLSICYLYNVNGQDIASALRSNVNIVGVFWRTSLSFSWHLIYDVWTILSRRRMFFTRPSVWEGSVWGTLLDCYSMINTILLSACPRRETTFI